MMTKISLNDDYRRLTDDEIIVYRDNGREDRTLVPYRRSKLGKFLYIADRYGPNISVHSADQPDGSSDEERERIRKEWIEFLNVKELTPKVLK